MGMSYTLRPYEDRDCDALLRLWEVALPLDAITRDEFHRRVLLDRNFERAGLILAFEPDGKGPVGIVLCLVLRVPIWNVGLLPHRGYITAFGVCPKRRCMGMGAQLLGAAEEFFRARNRTEIVLAPYPPNYFVPGVDKERYTDGIKFLSANGFAEYSEAIAMDAAIGRFEIAPDIAEEEGVLAAQGIVVELFTPARMVQFLEFMNAVMPGDWVEDVQRVLTDVTLDRASGDTVLIARDGEKIIGYCKFEGEHFGPFGVADSHQGKGIGTVLLARTIYQMRKRGIHNAFVLWTGERAARGVYGRLGFTVSRRFAVMKKKLA
ncbi:hypothetical protein BH09SUM1_BH09SUM1_28880 [soil metagenome]